MPPFLFHVLATLALVPAAGFALRRGAAPAPAVALAVAAAVAWSAAQASGPWPAGFSTALWLTIAATAVLAAGAAAWDRRVGRLGALLYPYLVFLGLLATAWGRAPVQAVTIVTPLGWFASHVAFAVATYALVTLAALAASAVLLHERALARRQPSSLTRLLPAMADAEALEFRLLLAGEVVLGFGLATGVATEYAQHGWALAVDHKTVLSTLSFVALGILLVVRGRSGLRGRRAARWVLAGYLLLTLAYPGVKFVRDVLIG